MEAPMRSNPKLDKMYRSWAQMIDRCENPRNSSFRNYGGRGIAVCDRWHSFENFLSDMGERPDGMTIERVDNAKGYSPENCAWATRKEQLNNMRTNRIIEAFGKKQTLQQWCDEYAMPTNTLKNRIYRGGMTPEEALSMPIQKGYKFSPVKYDDADVPQSSRWKSR